jgi:hydrogenase expression/formation protein HypC
MCLAVPVKILRLVPPAKAVVSQGRGELEVDVSLLQNPRPGDHVIVHAGYAIEILSLQDAEERLSLFKEMESLMAEDEGK